MKLNEMLKELDDAETELAIELVDEDDANVYTIANLNEKIDTLRQEIIKARIQQSEEAKIVAREIRTSNLWSD